MADLSPSDDRFHPPPAGDPADASHVSPAYWTETSWHSCLLPERRMSLSVYPLFRPSLPAFSCGVYLWDDTAHEPWAVPYARNRWHLPPPDGDLTDLTLANGLRLRCVEPLRRYHLSYEDGDALRIDLSYEGLFPPHAVAADPERGHFDQPCRVTGTLHLRGEELAVDTFGMRDRSWSVREDTSSTRAGYSYATTSPHDAWHTMSFWLGAQEMVLAGYLVRDGEASDVVSGTRRVLERSADGYPLQVAVSATDRLGRALEVEGTCVNRFALQASPGLFAWMSLTRWQFEGGEAWGEDQDIRSPDLFEDL